MFFIQDLFIIKVRAYSLYFNYGYLSYISKIIIFNYIFSIIDRFFTGKIITKIYKEYKLLNNINRD